MNINQKFKLHFPFNILRRFVNASRLGHFIQMMGGGKETNQKTEIWTLRTNFTISNLNLKRNEW